jgi:hypothetical protein
MKRSLLIAASCLAAAVSAPTMAADVGVSVTVGQPGFYGHIDIGDFPQPQVVYRQPVLIQPIPVGVLEQPMYLRVPPGQRKKWKRYCDQYDACGRPVYFVRDDWYQNVYAPRYRERYEHDHRGGGDRDHDDRRDDDGDRGHGHGNGNGHGHGHGHDD